MFGNPVSDYFQFLGNEFSKNGYKVIYIFDGKIVKLPDNKVHTEYYTWPNKRPVRFKDFVFLAKLIRIEKPIITLSNFGSTNVMSVISFLFAVKNRLNYIHTTTTQINKDFKGGAIKLWFLRFRKKVIYALNNYILVNSNGTMQDVIVNMSINPNKIIVLPLLIKNSSLKCSSFDERKFTVTIVGRLDPSKGHVELLKLFKSCVSKYPKIVLNIVGGGVLLDKINDFVRSLELEKNVFFWGMVDHAKISEIFSQTLIGISSSVEEAYGLVNIESLREATPIICTRTAGSLDILEDKVNGRFIDMHNEESLLIAFDDIMSNWSEYSVNALKSFENKFSTNSVKVHYNLLNSKLNQ